MTTKAMIGYYDYRLVALSVLIAVFASDTALDLAGRTTGPNRPGSPYLARGRGDCYGHGHLVHALYRNAGFQLTGAGAVRLADGVAVRSWPQFSLLPWPIRRKSKENGLASGQTGSNCATARLRVAVRANFGVPRPNAKSGRSNVARSPPASNVGALLIGVGVGVGVGLLIAPARGDVTRADIAKKVSDFGEKVRDRERKPQGATGT